MDYNTDALVPQGVAGTGSAVIFPQNEPSPFQILEQQQKEAQAAAIHQRNGVTASLQGLSALAGKGWAEKDAAFLQGEVADLTKAYAYNYKMGRNPEDPNNPDYLALQQKKNRVIGFVAKSAEQKKQYDTFTKLYAEHPENYNKDWADHYLPLFTGAPSEHRLGMDFPLLGPKETSLAEELQKQHSKTWGQAPVAPGVSYIDPVTNENVMTSVKGYVKPEDQIQQVQILRLLKPEAVDKEFNKLTPAQQIEYGTQADVLQQDILKANPNSTTKVTPQDVYLRNHYGAILNTTQTTANGKNQPIDWYGRKAQSLKDSKDLALYKHGLKTSATTGKIIDPLWVDVDFNAEGNKDALALGRLDPNAVKGAKVTTTYSGYHTAKGSSDIIDKVYKDANGNLQMVYHSKDNPTSYSSSSTDKDGTKHRVTEKVAEQKVKPTNQKELDAAVPPIKTTTTTTSSTSNNKIGW